LAGHHLAPAQEALETGGRLDLDGDVQFSLKALLSGFKLCRRKRQMKLSDLEDADKIDNGFERIENKIERLENKIDSRLNAMDAKIDTKFNTLDAKINNQRVLMVAAIIGVLAQIVNAWIVALSHLPK
jgi:hypothetical protein